MKKIIYSALIATTVISVGMLSACGLTDGNSDSSLDGTIVDYSDNTASANNSVGSTDSGEAEVPSDATNIGGDSSSGSSSDSSSSDSSSDSSSSGGDSSDNSSSSSSSGDYEITESGSYYISSSYSGKITVSCSGVTLYLNNASITNKKKVIESDYDLTITLIGENYITNTNADGSNAIDVIGELTINGSGSLSITSTKNGVSADSIKISAATLDITCENDGLHAEISAYDQDTVTSQPTLSYDDGGYVYIENANITINSVADGIQADTFVLITGEDTIIDITTNGGAPSTVNEKSSDSGSGKGIKAGPADWGAKDANGDRTDFTDGDYQIIIENGTINIDANDDAIHTDGGITISGGDITIESGDDGIHGDEYIDMTDGSVEVSKCYEGVEAANIQLQGGKISVEAVDDGINAADGTATAVGVKNSNCQIVIDGGYVYVDADGDGVDSNGDIVINGGSLYISGQASGENAALDADGSIYINGGYVFAVGASGMVETPSTSSTQNIISFTHSSLSANTYLALTDESGNEIMSFTIPKACQSIIISCPELTKGSSYCIYGGSTCLTTFTVSSVITTVGSSTSVINPGGNSGGNQGGFNGGNGGGIFGNLGGR